MSQKTYTENLFHFNTSFDEEQKIKFLHAYGIVVAIINEELNPESLQRAKTVLKKHSKLDSDCLAISFGESVELDISRQLELENIIVILDDGINIGISAKDKAEQFILDFLESSDKVKSSNYESTLLKKSLDKSGIIYLLKNPSFEDILLIGKTQLDLKLVIASLDNDSLPYPFELAYACKVANMKLIEQTLHHVFDGLRLRKDRNFFKVSLSKPQSILELVALETISI